VVTFTIIDGSIDVGTPTIDPNVPINLSVPVDLTVPIAMHVSINGVASSAVIPIAVTVSVIVIAVSRRYGYSRAIDSAIVVVAIIIATPVIAITVVAAIGVATIVIAAPTIASGGSVRINLTRLEGQCAQAQHQNRKQSPHTSPPTYSQ